MTTAHDASIAPVTELLTADHERLDAVLAEAKRHLRSHERPQARARFATFREGLERHIVVEEEVLFPAFERHAGGGGGGPTAVMRAEHAEIRRLLAEVAEALEPEDAPHPTSALASLTAILLAHNGKEERILYPMSDRALAGDAAIRDAIAHRLHPA